MAKKGVQQYDNKPKSLSVKILDIENGFATYENVRAIRIKSKKFTLLIMNNYTPTLGEVDGSVDILLNDDELHYEKLNAYFEFNNNLFTLLIKERTKWYACRSDVDDDNIDV